MLMCLLDSNDICNYSLLDWIGLYISQNIKLDEFGCSETLKTVSQETTEQKQHSL